MNPQNPKKIKIRVESSMMEIIPKFIENRNHDVEVVIGALKDHAYEVIERIGHDMKGVGEGYGFDEITKIGLKIEMAARDKNDQEIQIQTYVLRDYLQRIEVVPEDDQEKDAA